MSGLYSPDLPPFDRALHLEQALEGVLAVMQHRDLPREANDHGDDLVDIGVFGRVQALAAGLAFEALAHRGDPRSLLRVTVDGPQAAAEDWRVAVPGEPRHKQP